MNENDDPKIRKLLKASPSLTPPESFYRGVLEKIERKKNARAFWSWGIPVKVLATACVLFIIVLATHETKQSGLVLPERKSVAHNTFVMTQDKPFAFEPAENRLDRTLSKVLMRPKSIDETNRANLKSPSAPSPWVTQARDTKEGIATQGSFQEPQSIQAKPAAPMPAAAPALQNKYYGGIRAQDTFSPKSVSETSLAAAPAAKVHAAAAGSNFGLAGSGGGSASAGIQKDFQIAGPAAGRAILEKTMPGYPDWAKDAGLVGNLRLYIVINAQGAVNLPVHVTRTSGSPKLDQLAIDAVKKWKFAPASEDTWANMTFQFPPQNTPE